MCVHELCRFPKAGEHTHEWTAPMSGGRRGGGVVWSSPCKLHVERVRHLLGRAPFNCCLQAASERHLRLLRAPRPRSCPPGRLRLHPPPARLTLPPSPCAQKPQRQRPRGGLARLRRLGSAQHQRRRGGERCHAPRRSIAPQNRAHAWTGERGCLRSECARASRHKLRAYAHMKRAKSRNRRAHGQTDA